MAAMGAAPLDSPEIIHVTATAQNSTNPQPVTLAPQIAGNKARHDHRANCGDPF